MTITVEYDSADLARLHRALDKLDVEHLVHPQFETIGTEVYQEVRVQPNWIDTAPPFPYWIRGQGWQYASGRNDGSSKDLYHSWYTVVGPDYVKVGVKPEVTYASYVHGPDQAPVHARHGWRKLYETAVKMLPGIIRKLEARAKQLWEGTK